MGKEKISRRIADAMKSEILHRVGYATRSFQVIIQPCRKRHGYLHFVAYATNSIQNTISTLSRVVSRHPMAFNIHARILNNPSENFGYRAIEGVEGIEIAQIAIVAVREGGEPEREYICVNCASVQPTPRQCRLLAATLKPIFPGATVAILKWEGKPGAEDVYLAPGQPGTPTGCAAAFAVYKVAWGWDESPTMAIRVNGDEIRLSVEGFDGEHWLFRKIEQGVSRHPMAFNIHARILNNSSENFGYRAIEGVEGIEIAQIAIVAVREGGEPEREYICVNCAAVQPTPRQFRLLAATLKPIFPGATVAILKWEGKPGAEDVYLAPGQPGTPTGCAAAFSLYKMCWGWDESPTFAIGVNGEEVVLCVGDAQDEYRSFRRVTRLGRRDAMRGLANSMLNFFMSRDHDFFGYWAIGQYHRAVETFPEKKIVVDFQDGVVTPESEIGSKMASRYAEWYWRMLNRRGIPSVWIRSATVTCTFEVEKPGDPRRHRFGGVGGFYDCVAEVVDRRGKTFRLTRDGWSWPHDPKREYRRVI